MQLTTLRALSSEMHRACVRYALADDHMTQWLIIVQPPCMYHQKMATQRIQSESHGKARQEAPPVTGLQFAFQTKPRFIFAKCIETLCETQDGVPPSRLWPNSSSVRCFFWESWRPTGLHMATHYQLLSSSAVRTANILIQHRYNS